MVDLQLPSSIFQVSSLHLKSDSHWTNSSFDLDKDFRDFQPKNPELSNLLTQKDHGFFTAKPPNNQLEVKGKQVLKKHGIMNGAMKGG